MHSISLITKIYFLLILGLLVVFSINSIAHSGRKAFWRDETHGIEALARLHPLRSVIYGVKSQGSAAPLEYLISSVTYRLRFSLNYLFLQPHQYLRIHNVVVIWGVILITAYWINKYESFTVQTAFVIGTAFFLFNSTTYYYSSELRPFNLWGSISFLLLFALRFRDKVPRLWIVALFGLAFTITASTIQLLGIAIALVLFSQRSLKEILPLQPRNSLLQIVAKCLLLSQHLCSQEAGATQTYIPAPCDTQSSFRGGIGSLLLPPQGIGRFGGRSNVCRLDFPRTSILLSNPQGRHIL